MHEKIGMEFADTKAKLIELKNKLNVTDLNFRLKQVFCLLDHIQKDIHQIIEEEKNNG